MFSQKLTRHIKTLNKIKPDTKRDENPVYNTTVHKETVSILLNVITRLWVTSKCHNGTASILLNVSCISTIGIIISNTGNNRMWDKVDVESQFYNLVNINYYPNSASQLLAFDKSRWHMGTLTML